MNGGKQVELSLLFSGYILIAFVIYYNDRSIMKNILKYMQSAVPAPKVAFVAAGFILALMLPILSLKLNLEKLYKWLFSVKEETKSNSEEVEKFAREYYPETIYDLDEVSIELERDDIDEFVRLLPPLFDAGFGESRVEEIMQDLGELLVNDENRHVFYPTYQSKRVPVVVEVKRIKKNLFELAFQSEKDVADAIGNKMDVFCE